MPNGEMRVSLDLRSVCRQEKWNPTAAKRRPAGRYSSIRCRAEEGEGIKRRFLNLKIADMAALTNSGGALASDASNSVARFDVVWPRPLYPVSARAGKGLHAYRPDSRLDHIAP